MNLNYTQNDVLIIIQTSVTIIRFLASLQAVVYLRGREGIKGINPPIDCI